MWYKNSVTDLSAEQHEIPLFSNVRLAVAGQIHNAYLEKCGMLDPVAAILEEKAGQRIVVVRVGPDEEVQALGEDEAQSAVDTLGSQEILSRLQLSSLRYDDRHDRPEVVRALMKKIGHREAHRKEDPNFSSAFDAFPYPLQVNSANLSAVQKTALGIIEEVLADIGTVIETAKRTDIIASSGRGVRLFRHQTEGGTQIVFGGFIDYLAYNR